MPLSEFSGFSDSPTVLRKQPEKKTKQPETPTVELTWKKIARNDKLSQTRTKRKGSLQESVITDCNTKALHNEVVEGNCAAAAEFDLFLMRQRGQPRTHFN